MSEEAEAKKKKKKVNKLNREQVVAEIKESKEKGQRYSKRHHLMVRRAESLGLKEGVHF
jgi:ribosomal protein L11